MKKKFVLIGDPESIFVREYIQKVLFSVNYNITLLSVRNNWSEWYEKNGISVISVAPDKEWLELPKEQERALALEKRNKICDTFDMIDILQVHFCAGGHMYCYKKLASKSKWRVMSYWGSDILSVQQKEIDLNFDAIKNTDVITLCGKKLMDALVFHYGKLATDKSILLDFGNSCFNEILNCEKVMSKAECKLYWKIDPKSISVMVGYNAGRRQQHIKVIKQVDKISDKIKKKLTFVFHLGYGDEDKDEYCIELEKILKKSGLNYVLIKDFLEQKEIAKLRLACDIFIHAQLTDAMSASIQEYLFSGSKVINPSWLIYPELVERGIKCYEYDKFSELSQLVEDVISNSFLEKEGLERVRNGLLEMSSWEILIPRWHEVLKIS